MKREITITKNHGKSKPQLELEVAQRLKTGLAEEYGIQIRRMPDNGFEMIYEASGSGLSSGATGKLTLGSWYATINLKLPMTLSIWGEKIEEVVSEEMEKALR